MRGLKGTARCVHVAAVHDALLSCTSSHACMLTHWRGTCVAASSQVLATTGVFAWGRGFMQQAKTELAPKSPPAGQDIATFAGGCFWGLELAFQREPGVTHTSVGYTQGDVEAPSYQAVCSGSTGHAEAVQVRLVSCYVMSERHIMLQRLLRPRKSKHSMRWHLPHAWRVCCRCTSIRRRQTMSAYWRCSLIGQIPQPRTGMTRDGLRA